MCSLERQWRTWHWYELDGHAQIIDRTVAECVMKNGHGVTAWCNAGRWPRSVCALKKDNDGHMCEHSLATHPFHPFCCKEGSARNRPHRAVQCTLRRLIEQAGCYADLERRVPEPYDWVIGKDGVAPQMRCAILDVVSWFPGALQQQCQMRGWPLMCSLVLDGVNGVADCVVARVEGISSTESLEPRTVWWFALLARWSQRQSKAK